MIEKSIASSGAKFVWRYFGKSIIQKSTESLKQRWKKFNFSNAEKAYNAKVEKLYGKMQILGMSEPINLGGIYTQVKIYEKLSSLVYPKSNELNELKSMFLKKDTDLYMNRVSSEHGLNVVERNQKLFILGKPGSGKTTFLKHITLHAVNGCLAEYTPIFISLHDYSKSCLTLFQYIVRQFNICDFPDAEFFCTHILKNGRAIILFDGLDEVSTSGEVRDKVIQTISEFIRQYNKNRVLITCRIAATEYLFEDFVYVEMADFDTNQIHSFVEKWFYDSPQIIDQFFEEFNKNKGLMELSRIPLLLSLLCMAFEANLSFPKNRIEIYEDAIDVLLRRWSVSRKIKRDPIYDSFSIGRLRHMLETIAANSFSSDTFFYKENDLIRDIVSYLQTLPSCTSIHDVDGKSVLKGIEANTGIIVERKKDLYSFSHLTIQEYFTAKFYVSEGNIKNIVSHVGDDTWREIILITSQLMRNADDFFNEMIPYVEGMIRNNEKIQKIVNLANSDPLGLFLRDKGFEINHWLMDNRFNTKIPEKIRSIKERVNRSRSLELSRLLGLEVENVQTQNRIVNLIKVLGVDYSASMFKELCINAKSLSSKNDKKHYFSNINTIATLDECLSFPTKANVDPTAVFGQDRGGLDVLIKDISKRAQKATLSDDWFLDINDEVLLHKYLKATQLLTDCLRVSAVSNRAIIEAKLLRSPQDVYPKDDDVLAYTKIEDYFNSLIADFFKRPLKSKIDPT